MGPSFTAASIAFNVLELLGTITSLAFYLCASSAHAMRPDTGWLVVRLTTRFDYINCVIVSLSSILIILCAISSGVCLRAVDVRLRALVIPPAFKNLSSYSTYLPGSILIITGVVIHSLILLLALKLKHVKRQSPPHLALFIPPDDALCLQSRQAIYFAFLNHIIPLLTFQLSGALSPSITATKTTTATSCCLSKLSGNKGLAL